MLVNHHQFQLRALLSNRQVQGLRVRGSGVDSAVNEHSEDERNAAVGDSTTRLKRA